MNKLFTPDDLKYVRYLSWPAVSPDGTRIAFVEKVAEEAGGTFPPKVRVLEKATGKYVYETPEGMKEQQPLFLRDGRLCTLCDQSGEYQLWIRDMDDNCALKITSLRHGLVRYRVSGDMETVAFEATLYPGEAENGTALHEMTPEEKAAWLDELDHTPYGATDLIDKMDEWYGMRKGEKSFIGLCGTDGSNARILDLGGMESTFPAVTEDGSRVFFYGKPYTGAKGNEAELFVCGADGSGLKQLNHDQMLAGSGTPVLLKNGTSAVVLAYRVFEGGGFTSAPLEVPADGGAAAYMLDCGDETVCEGAGQVIVGRAENGENDNQLFVSGDRLWFQSAFHGRNDLCSVSLNDPKDIRAEIPGDTDVQSFGMNAKGDVAYMQGNIHCPAELFADGKRLTDENAWLRDYPQGRLEDRWIDSTDGKVKLHYWLLHPVNEEPGKRYPAVLDVHGGPQVTYGCTWWHEFHAMSAAGLAVIYGDPRGSVGYGHDFGKGGICWKQGAMDDLIAMCDDAVATGLVDKSRIGITGGSYGGYMTVKMIGSNHYFAAAAAQRALINLATSYGTGDMGFVSSEPIPKDFTMLKYLTDRARNSNITRVDNIQAPTLILHAGNDFRCTFEQAEQLFVAMHERIPDVPVRLVRFPGANHGLTRSGLLHHQICHLQEIVNWFVKYLGEEAAKHE